MSLPRLACSACVSPCSDAGAAGNGVARSAAGGCASGADAPAAPVSAIADGVLAAGGPSAMGGVAVGASASGAGANASGGVTAGANDASSGVEYGVAASGGMPFGFASSSAPGSVARSGSAVPLSAGEELPPSSRRRRKSFSCAMGLPSVRRRLPRCSCRGAAVRSSAMSSSSRLTPCMLTRATSTRSAVCIPSKSSWTSCTSTRAKASNREGRCALERCRAERDVARLRGALRHLTALGGTVNNLSQIQPHPGKPSAQR